MINKIKDNLFFIILIFFCMLFLAANIRINVFKYNNFDFGKFDLGNMTQMVWNASQGRGLMLTDYFGTNLPRWAMSHVDPILFIFVPVFLIFPYALTLVISQLVLLTLGALVIFKLANLHIQSKFACFLIGLSYLFNPSIGYLSAFTGFHGVTAVIPFFLLAFYIFERMHLKNNFSKINIILFWIFLILTMMGKEQLPAYIAIYGLFILFFRNISTQKFMGLFKTIQGKIGISMFAVGTLWFIIAFFVVIPANAHYRIEGYKKFAQSLEINDSSVNDVALPNYFLMRYEEFGDSYIDVLVNMILDPKRSLLIFFGGDKSENFLRTFEPLAYLPFAYPGILAIALVDFVINFMTTTDGVGTSEITNHRISMIIPILYISAIFGLLYLSKLFGKKVKPKIFFPVVSLVMFLFTLYTAHVYNNPVYLWFKDAINNKIISKVFAKTGSDLLDQDLNVGDVVRLSELDTNDRECALKIVKIIPDGMSVSGPDSLGAHLAKRETYAIFPALFNEADYVIVDVFSKKILTILNVNPNMIRDVVEMIIKSENYKLEAGCGNYFVFKNIGKHEKRQILPIQERFEYKGGIKLDFFQGLEIVDYNFPKVFVHGQNELFNIVYHRVGSDADKNGSLDNFLMFTSFVNKKTGEIYQQANLASFALISPSDWDQDRYYIEDVEIVMPKFVENGEYMLMAGMGNSIRTRSIYLGDITVK